MLEKIFSYVAEEREVEGSVIQKKTLEDDTGLPAGPAFIPAQQVHEHHLAPPPPPPPSPA